MGEGQGQQLVFARGDHHIRLESPVDGLQLSGQGCQSALAGDPLLRSRGVEQGDGVRVRL
jgi:hypothetical protein